MEAKVKVYVVLVVYACVRFSCTDYYDPLWKDDVETCAGKNKRSDGVSDVAVYEKHGYMEVCSRLLWALMVENRMDYADSIHYNTFPGLWQVG